VTEVPNAHVAEHVPGQEMPEGELVTVPLPVKVTVIDGGGANKAVTSSALLKVNVQEPVPAPGHGGAEFWHQNRTHVMLPQAMKCSPPEGEAVRVTFVPYGNDLEQVPGHEMPEGELVTLPLPLTLTVSVSVIWVNVAVTLLVPFIVREQVPVPEQAPDQPVKVYPLEGTAVRVTPVPYENVVEQVPGQEMPAGELVTVPPPVILTVSGSVEANVAVTLLAAFIVSVQPPVPEQAPDQPEKPYPLEGAAVRVTPVPYENAAEQVPGQEMPEGELVTVPLPLTPTVSVSGIAVKVALTVVGLYKLTSQAPVPEHEPDQPEKVYPVEGEAVRLTVVP
jgi:hypothetical protein